MEPPWGTRHHRTPPRSFLSTCRRRGHRLEQMLPTLDHRIVRREDFAVVHHDLAAFDLDGERLRRDDLPRHQSTSKYLKAFCTSTSEPVRQ